MPAGVPNPHYPTETKYRALELRRQGLSLVQVARRLGCHHATVLAWERRPPTMQLSLFTSDEFSGAEGVHP